MFLPECKCWSAKMSPLITPRICHHQNTNIYRYKMMDGKKWRRNTLLTATLFPGFLGMVSYFVNFFLWHKNSTKAIPFTTMLCSVASMGWNLSSLTYLGAFFGYRKDKIEAPVAVNSIPRFIPPQRIQLNGIPQW